MRIFRIYTERNVKNFGMRVNSKNKLTYGVFHPLNNIVSV